MQSKWFHSDVNITEKYDQECTNSSSNTSRTKGLWNLDVQFRSRFTRAHITHKQCSAEVEKQLRADRLILILIGALAASSTCYRRQPTNINVDLSVLQKLPRSVYCKVPRPSRRLLLELPLINWLNSFNMRCRSALFSKMCFIMDKRYWTCDADSLCSIT